MGVQGVGVHDLSDGGHAQSGGTSTASSNLDAEHDPQLPIKVRRLSDIVADLSDQEVQLHVVSPDEPAIMAEA
jgi:hypothetical protein